MDLVMENQDHQIFIRQFGKLSASEFLKMALAKLDQITVETEEELLLLDKLLYKASNISRDFKMQLLTPELREKFTQRMKDLKLDENDFTNMLKPYEKGKGPYNKPPAIPEPQKVLQEVQPQALYKPDPIPPEKAAVAPKAPYGGSGRPVEKGGMTPKRRARSSSSSSSSSSSKESEKERYEDKIAKLQSEIARLNAAKSSEQRPTPPSKYSFSLKKPETQSSRQLYRPSPPNEEYFERTVTRAREPRSERGDRDHREHSYSPPRRGKESPPRRGKEPPRVFRGGVSHRRPFSKRGK